MIYCIGAGPGSLDYITQRGKELIEQADVVAGFGAVVDVIRPLVSSAAEVITMGYKDQTAQLQQTADLHQQGKRCVVVFMGDMHFSGFQFLERVERACGHKVETVPGISSAQILASRGRVCFDETTFITFHRRGDIEPFKKHLLNVLRDDRNAIVIPLPWSFMPKDITYFLLEHDIPPQHPVEVWENLTQQDAQWKGQLKECTDDFSDMSIMLIRTLNPLHVELSD